MVSAETYMTSHGRKTGNKTESLKIIFTLYPGFSLILTVCYFATNKAPPPTDWSAHPLAHATQRTRKTSPSSSALNNNQNNDRLLQQISPSRVI